MGVRFFIFFIFLSCHLRLLSQDSQQEKINAELKRLPALKDTNRINSLNNLGYYYAVSNYYKHYDSVSLYALPAIDESRKSRYKKGLFLALWIYGYNEVRINSARAEKKLLEALLIVDSLEEDITVFKIDKDVRRFNRDTLRRAIYPSLMTCMWSQGRYQEALEYSRLCFEYDRKILKEWQSPHAATAGIYMEIGNYEKAFELAKENMDWAEKRKAIRNAFWTMGSIYTDIGDFETARKYFDEGFRRMGNDTDIAKFENRQYYRSMGDLHMGLKNYDSAKWFYTKAMSGYPTTIVYRQNLAMLELARGNYSSARVTLDSILSELLQGAPSINRQIETLNGLSEINLHFNNLHQSLQFARQALALGKKVNGRKFIVKSYELLSSVYTELKNTDSAFYFYKKHIQVRDSLLTGQFRASVFEYKRIAEDEKKLSQIKLLEQSQEISQQKLRQSRIILAVLIGGLLMIAGLSIVFFRNLSLRRRNEKLQNEKLNSELQHKATDLEMQALRAQMNPHFIFNCLSSINRFILKNETEIASDYLTRFSRLIRLVLIHSQSSMILLKEEIEMLRLYLDMEQLRFKNSFDYNISFTNSIDPEIIFIPPLLLQPFCENAIWHGLMNKQGQGHLEIRLSMQDNILNCTITDNGVGRRKAAELKSKSGEKQKSLGLKITAERLALINEEKGVKTNYEIEDVLDEKGDIAGTRVILRIRYKENIKEPVKELSHTT